MKKKKGITLIALVITIIVLLILAGVSLNLVAGSDGILGKASTAQQKTIEAKVNEKVQLLLTEYRMEKIDDANLTLLKFFETMKVAGEIDEVEDNGDGTIDVKLEGYTVTIEIENQTVIEIKKSNDIKFVYELMSQENNKFYIKITIEDKKNGINTVEFPNGDTQEYSGQKEVILENYEIEEGRDYSFVIRNMSNMERNEVINLTKPMEPEVATAQLGYPIVTLMGVKSPELEIRYDERAEFNHYYSVDDGETWDLYTGPINISSTNVKAKSVHKKCQVLFTESNLTVQLPEDTLTIEGYDNKLETFKGDGNAYRCIFEVDSSGWHQNCVVNYRLTEVNDGARLGVEFYNSEGTLMDKRNFGSEYRPDNHDVIFEIPENVTKIVLYSDYASRALYIHEVCINGAPFPKIVAQYDETKVNKEILEYPLLTSNGVMNCRINPEIGTNITLKIDNELVKEGIENYYSLDGGMTWKLYTGSIETTYKGEGNIQAKSVNKYYNMESEVNVLKNYIKDLSLECTSTIAVAKEGFDDDLETYAGTGVIMIDDSIKRKRVRVKYKSQGSRTVNIANSQGTVIAHTPNGESGIIVADFYIPEEGNNIVIGWNLSMSNDNLYEIDIASEVSVIH